MPIRTSRISSIRFQAAFRSAETEMPFRTSGSRKRFCAFGCPVSGIMVAANWERGRKSTSARCGAAAPAGQGVRFVEEVRGLMLEQESRRDFSSRPMNIPDPLCVQRGPIYRNRGGKASRNSDERARLHGGLPCARIHRVSATMRSVPLFHVPFVRLRGGRRPHSGRAVVLRLASCVLDSGIARDGALPPKETGVRHVA